MTVQMDFQLTFEKSQTALAMCLFFNTALTLVVFVQSLNTCDTM